MKEEREPTYRMLDPTLDPARWEALVAGVVARARPELERRAAGSPGAWLADWARPALAAAAVLTALATAGLLGLAPQLDPSGGEPAGVGPALGWPAPVEMWAETGRRPYLEEMLIAMEVTR